MALKLRPREIPVVNFRRVLPEWLGPGGECYIEVDARPGGIANPQYLAASEALMIKGRVMDAKAKRIEENDEDYIRTKHRNVLEVVRDRFGILYDACVIEWRSNILDGDAQIETTRANFLALTEEKVPEIAAALADLEQEVLEAGRLALAEDEETVKN